MHIVKEQLTVFGKIHSELSKEIPRNFGGKAGKILLGKNRIWLKIKIRIFF